MFLLGSGKLQELSLERARRVAGLQNEVIPFACVTRDQCEGHKSQTGVPA